MTTGDIIDLDNIPIDDELTLSPISEGSDDRYFRFDQLAAQSIPVELHPTVFKDLIHECQSSRSNGPYPRLYCCKHDKLVSMTSPCMGKYSCDTYGITVYHISDAPKSPVSAFTRGERRLT